MTATLRSRDVAALILDAYQRTGATPVAGASFTRLDDGSTGRCAVGVLSVVAGITNPAEWLPNMLRITVVSSVEQIGKRLELPYDLLRVLAGAFDHAFLRGVPSTPELRRQLRRYRKNPDAQVAVMTAWRVVRALRAAQTVAAPQAATAPVPA